jgi:hypothetical protein
LYDQETRTTYPTLIVDQKTYKLGDSGDFRVAVIKDAPGEIRVEYRSSFCIVRQSFAFVASAGAAMPDGISIRFDIENVSEKESSVGLRFLLDTWMGEKSGNHFGTKDIAALSVETSLSGDFGDTWIRSPGDAGASLQIQLAAPATKPDRAVAANWKRLNDAPWAFDANPSRTFTLLPYSINDSAIALFYEPAALRPGASRSVLVVLGNENEGYPGAAGVSHTAASAAAALDAPLDAMTDLVAVRSVLDALNAALASGASLSDAEIAEMQATLERLEARKASY